MPARILRFPLAVSRTSGACVEMRGDAAHFSQYVTLTWDVLPPSPRSSSLDRYGEWASDLLKLPQEPR